MRASLTMSFVFILGACGDDGGALPDGPGPTADAPDGPAPTAAVVFPTAASILVHGDRYPIIVSGADDEGVERLDVVIDGAVLAGGPGVPMLWRSGSTGADAGARSAQEITTSGSFEFVVPARMTQKVIGLGDVDTGGVVGDIDLGFYFTPVGFNLIGSGVGVRSYASGDAFRIDVTETTVAWRHNGTLLITAARPSGSRALHVETWLPGAGAAIADARIAIGADPASPVTWIDQIDTTAGTAFATTWNSSTHPDGDIAIAGRATDTDGAATDSSPVTIAIDNTSPTCTLTSPTGGTVSGVVQLAGQASDAHLATIAFFVDGQLHSQHDGQASAASAWNTGGLADGAHTVELRAYDAAFHSVACPVTVTVDNL